jgi:hypothetical protein
MYASILVMLIFRTVWRFQMVYVTTIFTRVAQMIIYVYKKITTILYK